ncbi:MAG: DUF6161 domain-containing protein [bacterium]
MSNNDHQTDQQLHFMSQQWQNKTKQYQRKANLLFLLFITLLILLAYGVSNLSNNFILTTDVNAPQLLIYGFYFVLFTLGVWIARTILKHAFKNFYLKENAHEKETIILSYLALKEGGAGLEISDNKINFKKRFFP